MAERLGKIDKPQAGDFTDKKKLYLIPLIFCGEDAPPEYAEKCNLYWEQIRQHIANLESKIGKVCYIFHESITAAGENGLKVLEKLNPPCYQIAQDKCQNGAALEATEDKELAAESMDWGRCLLTGFVSQKVAERVTEFYLDALRKRYEYIARRIDETLKAGEVGMLFIQESHMVQFPRDIEVFSVAPPALDEIHRWQREKEGHTCQTEKTG